MKNFLQRALLIYATISANLVLSAPIPIVQLSKPVMDTAGIISEPTKAFLNQQLEKLHNEGGSQIAIYTVPKLEDETIEQLGIRAAEQWQLGSKDQDNGVIVLIASEDHKLRIEVGQGLEGQLTDLYANRIIREKMAPLFRAGDYDVGVVAGIVAIVGYTDPEFKFSMDESVGRKGQKSQSYGFLHMLLFGFIMFIVVLSKLGGGGSGRSWRSNSSSWGGGGFGGGSGGFGGGGGGFSGGGSSGSW